MPDPTRPGVTIIPSAAAHNDPSKGGSIRDVDPQAPVEQIVDPDFPDSYIYKPVVPQISRTDVPSILTTQVTMTPVDPDFLATAPRPVGQPLKLSAVTAPLPETPETTQKQVAVTFHLNPIKHVFKYHDVIMNGTYMYLIALAGTNPPELEPTPAGVRFKITIDGHHEYFLCSYFGQRFVLDRYDITCLGIAETHDQE